MKQHTFLFLAAIATACAGCSQSDPVSPPAVRGGENAQNQMQSAAFKPYFRFGHWTIAGEAGASDIRKYLIGLDPDADGNSRIVSLAQRDGYIVDLVRIDCTIPGVVDKRQAKASPSDAHIPNQPAPAEHKVPYIGPNLAKFCTGTPPTDYFAANLVNAVARLRQTAAADEKPAPSLASWPKRDKVYGAADVASWIKPKERN